MTAPLGSYLWKALDVEQLTETGTFKGYLSTWDVDHDNERFAKGAYTRSIFEYVSAGVMPAVIWQHDLVRGGRALRERAFDTANVVGRVMSMKEDDRGLLITAKLDMSTERGKLIYQAMKKDQLALSVGFVATQWHDEDGVKTFDEAEILEATLTPNPANPEARIIEVKGSEDDARFRSHLRSNHAVQGRMLLRRFSIADLVTIHRRLHVNAPASEQHISTFSTDGKSELSGLARVAAEMERDRRTELAVREAKAAAERDRLVEKAVVASAAATTAASMSQYTLEEFMELEREQDQARYEAEVAASDARDAEREREADAAQAAVNEARESFRDEFGIGEVMA